MIAGISIGMEWKAWQIYFFAKEPYKVFLFNNGFNKWIQLHPFIPLDDV